MKRIAVKHVFAPGRIAFALFLGFIQYSVGYAQAPVRIPQAIKVSQEGRLPLPDVERQFLLSDLSVGTQKNVFPAPPCLSGRYYVGVQLLYDLGNRQTTQPWTADLEIDFLHGTDVKWTKPLRVEMGTQTFITTVFHDTLVSCDGNYSVSIKTKNTTAQTPQENIYLKVLLFEHLEEAFIPSTVIEFDTIYATGGYASIKWKHPGTATAAYDLEWVFIEDYEPFNGTTAAAAFTFKEPVRISTANRFYQHALVYPKGRLWYRVRALGYNPAYPTHRIPGQWFYYSANAGIAVSNTQADKTWQRQTAFTENGQYKHGVSYLDGTLRSRQQLTNLSSEKRTLVGESLYDYEGRKSVDVLAAPAPDSALTYHSNFHLFSTTLPAVADRTGGGRQKFHYDNRRIENSPMSAQAGAGKYYSPSNSFTGIHRDYTPQANGYVYSQTEYLNDATGSVSRQGGVGQRFRIDSLHAVRQFYGTAVTEELVRLFGSNAGVASHYRKNLAVDANGQVSVTYQDQEGRTIATALAGEKPTQMKALPSYTALSPTPVTVNAGARNRIQNGVSITTHSLLNTSPSTAYTFRYDLSAYAATLAQLGCQTCTFDLKITLTNPEGRLLTITNAAGNESSSPYAYERRNISAASCINASELNNVTFRDTLPDIGNYTLVKTLTPHDLSFEQLTTLIKANPAVQQDIQQIRNSYVLQPAACEICSESCPEAEGVIETVIGEVATRNCDNLYQQIVSYFRQQYGQTGEEPYQVPLDSIQAHPTYCEYLLCNKNQPGDVFEKQLARSNSWEVAVSKGYHQALNLDPFFNNAALSGANYKGSAAAKLNDVLVATIPFDSNNDGILDDSKTYRGPLTQVIDPGNTAFYIDEKGKPNPAGKHFLYLDLMSRRLQMSAAAYDAQLSQHRWTLYKSFYLEAKRKTKLEIPEYLNCAGAKASLQLIDGLPQTPESIAAYGEAKGATGPVGGATLEMSIVAMENKCGKKLNVADSTAVAGHLQAYFNGNVKNFFRLILKEDLSSNGSLAAIRTILQQNGCSLDSVAVVNPIACAKDTTLYLPKPMFILPTFPPTDTPPPSAGTVTPLPQATLQQQYDALWAFYNATGGANWTNRTGWGSANPNVLQSVNGWYGLTVNSSGFVTEINVHNNNLNGSIPASIRQLTHLISLYITSNPNLSGPIPAEIGGMQHLQYLSLDDNRLSGPIPSTIGQLLNLTYLSLGANLLADSIPTEIGSLDKLQYLSFQNNLLTGAIPSSFGNLTEIWGLYLGNNSLSGSIPTSFGNLTKLYGLYLQNNLLSGTVPTSLWTTPRPDAILEFALSNNQFTFEDLLHTIHNKPAATDFYYIPQDSVDVRMRIGTPIGGQLTLMANVDRSTSPASRYQWFKVVNGTTTTLTPSPSATAYTYTTPLLTAADVGTRYYYKITNPDAPYLTLISRMRTLTPFDGLIVNTCLAYDQTNPTLMKLSSVPTLNELVARCQANAAKEDSILTELAIGKLVEIRASTAYVAYRTQCLSRVSEQLRYTYVSKEYHYTLYYYDQAGNLVQTVPPEGVKPLSIAQVADFMAGTRTDPPHVLKSQYQYNSLNALIGQKTPDGGESQFYYNNKGQLRLSQNAEQSKVKGGKLAYSYTRYDEQGRTIEVGELTTAQVLTTAQAQATLKDSLASLTFPLSGMGDYQLTDRTLTFYDFAKPGFQASFAQQYLRSRVSWSAVLEKGRTDTLASYYSYDVHGNVRSLQQSVPGLSNKRTDYRYDLVSGKVNYVFYQYGKADEFTHRYTYDADNRLTGVFTSSDGFLWNKEARYQYYLHGPLARLELGEYRVQALDNYYTLQGWIKGVNMPYSGDPGRDGQNGSSVGKDAFAYTLGYFEGDYRPLNASVTLSDSREKLWTRLQETNGHKGLYNGNIAWMVTDLPKVGQLANDRTKGMQGMLYQYDQLNRISQSRSLTNYNANTGFAARASGSTSAYDENYSYDANGNLLTLTRNDEAGALQDDFQYGYYPGSNKLREVKPLTKDKTVTSGKVIGDNILYRNLTLQGSSYVAPGKLVEVKALEKIQMSPNFRSAQGTDFWAHIVANEGTYQYDAIGNLVLDQDEGVKISWTPYGKVREVRVKGDSLITRFRYDAMGNRVEKRVLLADTTYALTRYLRDASGNVMAIYKDSTLAEQPLYGSSRLGEYRGGVGIGVRKLGLKNYELSNHLGNVLAVVSDKVGMQTDSVWASVSSTSDYYPFGLSMKGRSWSDTTGYKPRYGFNGKEKDNEIYGTGNSYDFGARIYNPRIGRWSSVDPRAGLMPSWSPYNFAFDSPLSIIDLDGQIPWPLAGTKAKNKSALKAGENTDNTVIRTSTYRDTNRPKGGTNPHIGIDYRAPVNTPFYSLGEGKVQAIGQTRQGAKYITIEYPNGDKIRFLHINSTAKGLGVGSVVKEGQYLGATGQTGTQHAHLHVDGKDKEGNEIDPEAMNYGKWTAEEYFGNGVNIGDRLNEYLQIMNQKLENMDVKLEQIQEDPQTENQTNAESDSENNPSPIVEKIKK